MVHRTNNFKVFELLPSTSTNILIYLDVDDSSSQAELVLLIYMLSQLIIHSVSDIKQILNHSDWHRCGVGKVDPNLEIQE